MIVGGETSSREVVDAHLARIDEVNGDLNAVVRVLADGARAGADAADAAVAAGGPLGPFHGVPFTIKENLDCTCSPTTQGVPAFAEAVPTVDSPVVERMKAAGLSPKDIKEIAHNGQPLGRFFFIEDPDGYKIEVLQRAGRFQ